jgi:hypothetical protein
MFDGAGNFPDTYTNLNPTIGTWRHYTAVYGNGIITTYLNGSQTRTNTFTNARTVTNTVIKFGNSGSGGSTCAEYDDFRIYNTALTAAQVRSVYSSQGAPAPSRAMPLPKLAWDFNGTTTPYIGTVSSTAVNGSITYGTGKYAQDIIMNGTSNIVYNISDQIVLDTGFTIAFWLKPLNVTTAGWIYDISATNYGDRLYASIQNNGYLSFVYLGFAFYSPYPLSVGTWYHITVTLVAGMMTLYWNGTYSAQSAQSTTGVILANKLSIAALVGGQGPNINAEYDDLRIFDRALTSAQVQSIYNQQGVPGRGVQQIVPTNDKSLVFYTPFDNLSLADVTGNLSINTNPLSGVRSNGFGLSTTTTPGSVYFDPGIIGNYSMNIYNPTSLTNWSYVSNVICYSSSTPYLSMQQGMSFAFWFKLRSPLFGNGGSQRSALFTFSGTGNEQDGTVSLFLQPSQMFFSYASKISVRYDSGVFNTTWQVNTWYHVVCTLQSNSAVPIAPGGTGNGATGNVRVYINGVSGTSGTYANTWVQSGTFIWPGTMGWVYQGGFDGSIDDFRSYNYELTSTQVSSLYSTKSPYKIQLTGTPLFSQLSPSATSSAVGAFSLRAVNGTSARAVQVRPVAAFPPTGFTSAVTNPGGNQYNQTLTGYPFGGAGAYTSNCSSWAPDQNTPRPWKAFDYETGTWWENNYGVSPGYNAIGATATSNAYSGSYTTTVSGSSIGGEWLQLGLPTAIVLYSYSMYNRAFFNGSRMPYQWVVAGSNDGTTWTTVDVETGITWTSATQTFTTTSTTPYLYFRMIVQAIQTGGQTNQPVNIGQWTLNGSNASWNTDFYADRLGNLLTAPVTGQRLANWLGGATGYVTTWYDQSGRGNHATQTTTANQPVIQKATKGPGYACLFSGSQRLALGSNAYVNNTPYTLQIVERRNVDSVTSGAGYFGWGGGEANPVSNVAHNGYRAYSLSYPDAQQQVWTNQYADDKVLTNVSIKFATAATENVAYTWHTHDLNHTARIYSYRGGTMYPSAFSTTAGTFLNFLRPVGINQYFLGWSQLGYYQGEIYELLVFTQSLYDLDTSGGLITKVYQNQLGAYGT